MPLSLSFRYISFNGSTILYRVLDGYDIGFGSTGINNRIRVLNQQDRTYIVDQATSKFYKFINNTKKANPSKIESYNDYVKDLECPINELPNWCAVLNIRFGDASGSTNYNVTRAILTASGIGSKREAIESKFYIYAAEICHPSTGFTAVGSGGSGWSTLVNRQNAFLDLSINPGPSGINANILATGSPQKVHDWHIALAIEPQSVINAPYATLSCIIEYI